MNDTNSKICLEAFNRLCDELSTPKLVSTEELQYWAFERGYQAALDELVSNMTIAANSQGQVLLNEAYLAKKAA